MKKKSIVISVSLLAFLVSFSLLYFFLPFEKKDLISHILCYFCFRAYLAVIFVSIAFPLRKSGDAEKITLSLPLVKTIVIFSLVGLLLTIAEYVVNIFVPVPFYVPLSVVLFLISGFAITIQLKTSNIRHILQNEKEKDQSTCLMKELRKQSLLLVGLSKDEVTRNNRSKLSDRLKYSDPVSTESTVEIEKKILTLFSKYKEEIKDNQKISDVQDSIDRIRERNTLCERNKK